MKKAISEIRGMDSAELRAKLGDLRKEQFSLRFRGAPEQVKQTSRRGAIRRTIARIMMVLAERDAAGAASAVAANAAAAKGVAKTETAKKGGKAAAGAK